MKLATVLRDDKMEKISPYSTVNRRGSNIFGLINYNLSEYVSLNYDFSIDNDLSTLEYSLALAPTVHFLLICLFAPKW